jgi:PRA1 family protein 1
MQANESDEIVITLGGETEGTLSTSELKVPHSQPSALPTVEPAPSGAQQSNATSSPLSPLSPAPDNMLGVAQQMIGQKLSEWRAQKMQNLRPFSEFLNKERVSLPHPREMHSRVLANLRFYQTNYLVMFGCLALYSVLTTPGLLLIVLLSAFAAFYLLYWRAEPITVAGHEVSYRQKIVALVVMSAVLAFFTSAGPAMLWIVGLFTLSTLGHALVFTPIDEDLFPLDQVIQS